MGERAGQLQWLCFHERERGKKRGESLGKTVPSLGVQVCMCSGGREEGKIAGDWVCAVCLGEEKSKI